MWSWSCISLLTVGFIIIIMLVFGPPDDGDDSSVGSVTGAGRKNDHVGDENDTTHWEDGDNDGDDGVQLLVLFILVNLFRSPERGNIRLKSRSYSNSPTDLFQLSRRLSSSILHPLLTRSRVLVSSESRQWPWETGGRQGKYSGSSHNEYKYFSH